MEFIKKMDGKDLELRVNKQKFKICLNYQLY